MAQYIITIVPVEDDDFAGPVSQTMVRIDTDRGHPSVREVSMVAPEGSSLVRGRLPFIDFELLLRAFVPDANESGGLRTAENRGSRVRSKRADTSPTKARRTSTGRSPVKSSHLGTGRAYRRAPSLEELETAYAETGSITGVANRFDVPVHTAQGWITRMRRRIAETADS